MQRIQHFSSAFHYSPVKWPFQAGYFVVTERQ